MAEIEDIAAARGDDLAAWEAAWAAGEALSGYRGRMVYSHMLVSALAAEPARDRERYLAQVGLGLAFGCVRGMDHRAATARGEFFTTRRNAFTARGSNCVPAQRRSSATASSWERAGLYGRSSMIAP